MRQEIWQVCGLMVQARPERLLSITEQLVSLPQTEVAVTAPDVGKLVVVMHGTDPDELLARIELARDIVGVLAVSLVYHQQDEQKEKP